MQCRLEGFDRYTMLRNNAHAVRGVHVDRVRRMDERASAWAPGIHTKNKKYLVHGSHSADRASRGGEHSHHREQVAQRIADGRVDQVGQRLELR